MLTDEPGQRPEQNTNTPSMAVVLVVPQRWGIMCPVSPTPAQAAFPGHRERDMCIPLPTFHFLPNWFPDGNWFPAGFLPATGFLRDCRFTRPSFSMMVWTRPGPQGDERDSKIGHTSKMQVHHSAERPNSKKRLTGRIETCGYADTYKSDTHMRRLVYQLLEHETSR